jgi:hypothetical protein
LSSRVVARGRQLLGKCPETQRPGMDLRKPGTRGLMGERWEP